MIIAKDIPFVKYFLLIFLLFIKQVFSVPKRPYPAVKIKFFKQDRLPERYYCRLFRKKLLVSTKTVRSKGENMKFSLENLLTFGNLNGKMFEPH